MTAWQSLLDALPHAPHYAYDWPALRDSCLGPLLEKLDAARQQPIWHGEGDAGTHTRMVCEALAGTEAFRALPEKRRQVLALAALLHDIGKAPKTRLEDGQWISPGHSAAGAHMARELLWKDFGLCGTPDKQTFREAVCLLVRSHMAPVHIIEQEDAELRLLKMAADGALAGDFTLDMLCLLAEADVRGRIAPDTREQLECIALCRQLAEEAGCLHGPGAFADAYTQRAYFQGRNVWRAQSLYNESWGEVILLCGLPGTGKDTWIAAQGQGLPVVSLDALRQEMGISPKENQGQVAQAAKAQARQYLRAKQPFIWNATNLTQTMRGQLISLFEDYGASVRLVYLETEWTENLRRNSDRAAVVPPHIVEEMLGKLIPPQRWEGQWVEWRCV